MTQVLFRVIYTGKRDLKLDAFSFLILITKLHSYSAADQHSAKYPSRDTTFGFCLFAKVPSVATRGFSPGDIPDLSPVRQKPPLHHSNLL